MVSINNKENLDNVDRIKLLLMDVDGVLTDGSIYIRPDGEELYVFNIYDGLGIKLWREAGFKIGWVTGRGGKALELRARKLKIDFLFQNAEDKVSVAEKLIKKEGLDFSSVAFIGDDLQDMQVMKNCGFSLAPQNARPEIKVVANYVSSLSGGRGAVRDCIEFLLRRKAVWDKILRKIDSK